MKNSKYWKKQLTKNALQLYLIITAPRILLSILGLVIGSILTPLIADLTKLPTLVIIGTSIFLSYRVGLGIEHRTSVPWRFLLMNQPLSSRAPQVSLITKEDAILQVSHLPSDTPSLERSSSKIMSFHRMTNLPQASVANFRRLQDEIYGITIREGKNIDSWIIMTPIHDDLASDLVEEERSLHHAVPYLRCSHEAETSRIITMIIGDKKGIEE